MTNADDAREKPLVLLVDGDENVVRLLNTKLTRSGYRVATAPDGEQGLQAALATQPAVVIVDRTPGRVDGFEIARRLARMGDDQRPAIVFLAAVEHADDVERALRCGCDDFVTKPFSPEELIHRLNVTLLRRRITAEHAAAESGAGQPL